MDKTVTVFLARKDDVTPADKKAAQAEYGDVTYADEANKKYPLDTAAHIKSAWSYINMPKNASKYEDNGKAIKRRVIAAWKKKIDKAGPPSAESHDAQFFVMDEYVATQPGEPYRLFKFGRIFKNGKSHDITPEFAARFKLPHFEPPIKLGSHEDAAPAGGHIKRLEVRGDGLWAVPEMTEKGAKAMAEGDYRYQSPEVIWEDGALEDPQTGELMNGPFIVGDALLHTPHLGNEAALYSYEPHSTEEGDDMTVEKIEIKQEDWDLFQALKGLFGGKKPEKTEGVDPEQYAAAVKAADELRLKVEKMESERAHDAEVMSVMTDLRAARFGAMFKAEPFAREAAEHFSALPKAEREWFMTKFAALAGQVDFASKVIGKEFGIEPSGNTDPVVAFSAFVAEKQKGTKLNYAEALKLAQAEQPDLYAAYSVEMTNRGRQAKKED